MSAAKLSFTVTLFLALALYTNPSAAAREALARLEFAGPPSPSVAMTAPSGSEPGIPFGSPDSGASPPPPVATTPSSPPGVPFAGPPTADADATSPGGTAASPSSVPTLEVASAAPSSLTSAAPSSTSSPLATASALQSESLSPSVSPSKASSIVPSPSVSASVSASADPVCVSVEHLAGFSRSELVYGRDVVADVLCDATASCATPGHMVVFHGNPMRMSSYCQLSDVSCRRQRMFVNSPRMVRGKRVASRTDGLQFTAMAARYDSQPEEIILRALVYVGL